MLLSWTRYLIPVTKIVPTQATAVISVHLPRFMGYTSKADMTASVWAISSTAWWMWMTAFMMENSMSEDGTSLRP